MAMTGFLAGKATMLLMPAMEKIGLKGMKEMIFCAEGMVKILCLASKGTIELMEVWVMIIARRKRK